MKYRKKPVIVEAYQTDREVIIHTLEGDMKASVGDYIITGVNGEQYPCKPDIFEKTYELAEETKLPLEDGNLKIIDKRGFQAHSISDKDERIYNIPVSEKKSVFRNYIF